MCGQRIRLVRMMKPLRLFKLMRVVKILKAASHINKLAERQGISAQFVRLIKVRAHPHRKGVEKC